MRRRIVPNWKSRLHDWSTIALGLSAGIVATWMTFPADWLQHLPTEWVAKGTGILSVVGLVSKFIVQGKPNDPK
jgi:purine-cytosine permease-like protein